MLTIFFIRFTTQPAIGVDPDNSSLSFEGIALDMDALIFLADRSNGAGRDASRQFRNEDPCVHAAAVLKVEIDLGNTEGPF